MYIGTYGAVPLTHGPKPCTTVTPLTFTQLGEKAVWTAERLV